MWRSLTAGLLPDITIGALIATLPDGSFVQESGDPKELQGKFTTGSDFMVVASSQERTIGIIAEFYNNASWWQKLRIMAAFRILYTIPVTVGGVLGITKDTSDGKLNVKELIAGGVLVLLRNPLPTPYSMISGLSGVSLMGHSVYSFLRSNDFNPTKMYESLRK